MAKRTAETVQKEPELIIQVDDFNRDKLGENVAKQISDFISKKVRRFGRPLNDINTLKQAGACLDNYFRDVRTVIDCIRLTLNKYYDSLGINLVSVNIEVEDDDGNAWLPTGELKPPTLGIVAGHSRSKTQVLAGFKVDKGAEQITVLSNILHARGFLPGENISPIFQTLPYPWQRGQTVIVPQSAMVGLNVPVVDMGKLAESGIPFRLVCDMAQLHQSQVYFCRYLTRDAVRKVLGLDNEDEGPGLLQPPWEDDS